MVWATLRPWRDALVPLGARVGEDLQDLYPRGGRVLDRTVYDVESDALYRVLVGASDDDVVAAAIAAEGPMWQRVWMLNWRIGELAGTDEVDVLFS